MNAAQYATVEPTMNGRSSYKQRWDPAAQVLYYEHRAVAAWHLGRPLQPGEVVHHVDGDKSNNHPDNLEVLPSQRVHMLLHHYRRREERGVQHIFPLQELLEL